MPELQVLISVKKGDIPKQKTTRGQQEQVYLISKTCAKDTWCCREEI